MILLALIVLLVAGAAGTFVFLRARQERSEAREWSDLHSGGDVHVDDSWAGTLAADTADDGESGGVGAWRDAFMHGELDRESDGDAGVLPVGKDASAGAQQPLTPPPLARPGAADSDASRAWWYGTNDGTRS